MAFWDDDDDKKKKFKERVLYILGDAEVQAKLRAILASDSKEPGVLPDARRRDGYPVEPEKRTEGPYKEKLYKAEEMISRLQKEIKTISSEKDRIDTRCKEAEAELAGTRAEWQRERRTYEEASRNWQRELNGAKEQLRQQSAEMMRQQADLQKALQQAKAVAEPFAEALQMYQQVQRLSPKLKERVEAYFLPKSPVSFLVCAGQEGKMLALWDITKEEMGKCSPAEKSILLSLLDYSIRRVNDPYQSPRYALRQDQAGARFDDRYHIRTKDSSSYNDPIAEVILPGIDRVDNRKVERKSVVRV